jgi:hypothetical protein
MFKDKGACLVNFFSLVVIYYLATIRHFVFPVSLFNPYPPRLDPTAGLPELERTDQLLGVHLLPARIGVANALLAGRLLRDRGPERSDRQLHARHILPVRQVGAAHVHGGRVLQ